MSWCNATAEREPPRPGTTTCRTVCSPRSTPRWPITKARQGQHLGVLHRRHPVGLRARRAGRARRTPRRVDDAAHRDAGLRRHGRNRAAGHHGGVVARETAIGHGGLLKGSELAQVFAALRANDLIWPYVVKGYLKGQAAARVPPAYWNSDDTNLPGPMFC